MQWEKRYSKQRFSAKQIIDTLSDETQKKVKDEKKVAIERSQQREINESCEYRTYRVVDAENPYGGSLC